MGGFDNTSLTSAKELAKNSFNSTITDVVNELFNGVDVTQQTKDKVKENYIKVNNKVVDSLLSVVWVKMNEIITTKAKVVIEGVTGRISYDE